MQNKQKIEKKDKNNYYLEFNQLATKDTDNM